MERFILYGIFCLGCLLQWIIRLKYSKIKKRVHQPVLNLSFLDYLLIIFSIFGFYILPLYFIFFNGFPGLNFHIPLVITIIFSLPYVFGIWLFVKAHKDLGKYWWMGYELSNKQELVTEGVYAWIRHPMYASFILMGIGNVFLLQNWIVSFSHLLVLLPLYIIHVPKEERQLLAIFGEAFHHYKQYTGKIFPNRHKSG